MEFWSNTLRYIINVAEGISRNQQIMYEAGRLGGTLMYMKYLKPGMPFRPADYYPFPWDPQPELMQLTPELIAAAKAFDEANPL